MALTDRVRRLLGGRAESIDQEHLRGCADMGDTRVADYGTYDDFYCGQQYTQLLDRAKAYLELAGVKFAENFVETIVDVRAERLNVLGFEVADNEQASEWLTKTVWQGNRMDALQATINTVRLVKGDAFVIASFDQDRNRPVFRFNRPELIKPVYDDDGNLLYLVKRWSTSAKSDQNPGGALIWRLNLYYPDRIEKYFSADQDGEHWAHYSDDEDESWPVWWTDTIEEGGDPLGVSAVHFRHKPLGNRYGRSLVKGLIPFQNELHKQILDLFYVMDAQGWGWPWMTGVSEGDALKVAVGDVIRLAKEEAKVGMLQAQDPRPLLEAIAATMHRFAAKARVPIHLLMLSGQMPSGESLKTANAPLVKASESDMVFAGDSYEDLMKLGWRLADVFGEGAPRFDPDAVITTIWDDAEDRNEVTEALVAESHHSLGVSRATTLRKLGYDPDEEAKQRKAEQAEEGPPPPEGDDDELDEDDE